MLSAVEHFGTGGASSTHQYVHHHPFTIAAATAAAASNARPHQQTQIDHYTIGSYNTQLQNPQILRNGGIIMPSKLPSSDELHNNNNNNNNKTPSIINNIKNNIHVPTIGIMSSAEFAIPHPKQPRYNNNNNNNNNNNTVNCNNSNNNCNGIPLHTRNSKYGCNNSNNSISIRSKYSTEQSSPVNLVTNNNNSSSTNINNNNNNCNSNGTSLHNNHLNKTPSPPAKINSPEILSRGSIDNHHHQKQQQQQQNISIPDADVMAGIYSQKIPFTPSGVTNAAAAAAVAYQLNYSHLYGRGAIYGTPPGLYPSHHSLSNRNQLHNRPTYITGQHENYSHFLPPPVTYSPPSVPVVPTNILRAPLVPTQHFVGTTHETGNHSLNNNLSNGNSILSGSQLSNINERQHHHSQTSNLSERQILINQKDKDNKTNIYTNGKINTNIGQSVPGFKVPSGKEGSLKHRILTRPQYNEKDIKRRSPITASVLRSSNNNNASTNFTKGSLIELYNGELRRVEDMRTEDFIQSAERSHLLQLADSTVVKIINTPKSVIITFSYNKNRSKVDMEASQEHPFFVYGQGWASCNPELSMQAFGLKCQRLQVGDVCISLQPRETSYTINNSLTNSSSLLYNCSSNGKDDILPQNLSRKLLINNFSTTTITIPTTATGTTVTSRLIQPTHFISGHTFKNGINSNNINHHDDNMNNNQTNDILIDNQQHQSPPLCLANAIPKSIQDLHNKMNIKYDNRFISTHCNNNNNSGEIRTSTPGSISAPTSRPPSNQPYYLGIAHSPRSSGNSECSSVAIHKRELNQLTFEQQAAIEESLSRKRRWSAPDICDDEDGKQPLIRKTCSNP